MTGKDMIKGLLYILALPLVVEAIKGLLCMYDECLKYMKRKRKLWKRKCKNERRLLKQ